MFFHYGADGLIGFNIDNTSEYYYKKNIQGDILGVYDSACNLVVKYCYDAWGNHKVFAKVGDIFVDILNPNEYIDNSEFINNKFIATLNPFRYRSYCYDEESGLYYLNSRYYDPELGRFINSDDISILANTYQELNGINLYIYCFNNPVNDLDQNGQWSWKKFWKTIAVCAIAVVGLAAVALITVATGGSAALVVVGTIVGMVTSAVTSAVTQISLNGSIDWSQLAIDSFIGAFTGALGASSFGMFGMGLGNAIASFGSSIATNWVNDQPIDWVDVGISAGAGFAMGLISGGGSQHGLTNHTLSLKQSKKNYLNSGNYSLKGLNGISNLMDYHIKNSIVKMYQAGLFNLITGFGQSLQISFIDTLIQELINNWRY